MKEENLKDVSPYEKLKSMILTGEIATGSRITESFISERLEISRIPVREAVQRLYHEGFLSRTGKNGYQIMQFNEQDIIDLYNYREAMDGMLVRLFSLRADPSQIYYLEVTVQNLEEILKAFDAPTLMRNDLDFHRTIARGAKNGYMEQQHEIILEKVLYIAQTLIRFGELSLPNYHDMAHYEETLEEHQKILEAIKERDPDRAERASRDSVQAGLKKTLSILALKRQQEG